jgi:hypothetical protein
MEQLIATIEQNPLFGNKYLVFIDGSYYAEFKTIGEAVMYCKDGNYKIVIK